MKHMPTLVDNSVDTCNLRRKEHVRSMFERYGPYLTV